MYRYRPKIFRKLLFLSSMLNKFFNCMCLLIIIITFKRYSLQEPAYYESCFSTIHILNEYLVCSILIYSNSNTLKSMSDYLSVSSSPETRTKMFGTNFSIKTSTVSQTYWIYFWYTQSSLTRLISFGGLPAQ